MPPSSNHSRREFLRTAALGTAALGGMTNIKGEPTAFPTGNSLKMHGVDIAATHPIVAASPASNFMEGSILGNGELGVVVEPRPDVILLHIGHNAVWDQRMQPLDAEKMKTFRYAMDKIQALPTSLARLEDDPWFLSYVTAGKESYAARKYPRPHCCGSVALGFDPRKMEVIGHRVLIDRGRCIVEFAAADRVMQLEIFVEPVTNRIWIQWADALHEVQSSPFLFIAIITDGSLPKEFPVASSEIDARTGLVSYRQILPHEEVKERRDYRPHLTDRAFCLSVRTSAQLHQKKPLPGGVNFGAWISASAERPKFVIELNQGLADAISLEKCRPPLVDPTLLAAAARDCATMWKDYWDKSSVTVDDALLEQTWYWNMYFLRCALHSSTVACGLYAICPYPHRELWWHSDYHMDYNTQQAFWSTFSSNHPELNLPYVEMVHHVLPAARAWARDYYQMRGACFPVSSYPVELRTYPYGAPVFNWMMCLSTWTVQGLWWHYLYTKDLIYLREKGFEPIKAVVQFMIDYIKRPEVQQQPWGDTRAHIWPSFPPEIYGLRPGLPRDTNADNLVDLTLLRFTFRAYLQACRELKVEAAESQDMRDAQDILDRLPPYPTAAAERGTIFVSVPAEGPEKVYNVPINLMTVFPGEHHGLHSSPAEYELAANTARLHQNEGGNDLVFLNLQRARLGLLDLEKFKRQIAYTLLPNGTCTDKNMQIGGRFGFSKTREYDWMASFGIWFENFSLPVVINECLLQSYHGELRFFPNWPKNKTGAFRSLRAAGAFLVSAECHSGRVQWIEILSEKGGELTIISPWKDGFVWSDEKDSGLERAPFFQRQTEPGDRLRLVAP